MSEKRKKYDRGFREGFLTGRRRSMLARAPLRCAARALPSRTACPWGSAPRWPATPLGPGRDEGLGPGEPSRTGSLNPFVDWL